MHQEMFMPPIADSAPWRAWGVSHSEFGGNYAKNTIHTLGFYPVLLCWTQMPWQAVLTNGVKL